MTTAIIASRRFIGTFSRRESLQDPISAFYVLMLRKASIQPDALVPSRRA
jgi:hypothetical protein